MCRKNEGAAKDAVRVSADSSAVVALSAAAAAASVRHNQSTKSPETQ